MIDDVASIQENVTVDFAKIFQSRKCVVSERTHVETLHLTYLALRINRLDLKSATVCGVTAANAYYICSLNWSSALIGVLQTIFSHDPKEKNQSVFTSKKRAGRFWGLPSPFRRLAYWWSRYLRTNWLKCEINHLFETQEVWFYLKSKSCNFYLT